MHGYAKVRILNQSNVVLARVLTDIITVYDSKSFPGVYPPTDLSKWFHQQGIHIGGGPYGRKISSNKT
jgi:hypothetical protein